MLPTGPHSQQGPAGPSRKLLNYQEITARIALIHNQIEQGEQTLAGLNVALRAARGGPDEAAATQKLEDAQSMDSGRREYVHKLELMVKIYQ